MFFMIGVNEKSEELDYDELITCDMCGAYGRLSVFMTYTVLYLFFIPVFKWNYRYFAKTSCCNTVYELDQETGEALRHGEYVKIDPSALNILYQGNRTIQGYKRCAYCGYETEEDFEYCPKCGRRF